MANATAVPVVKLTDNSGVDIGDVDVATLPRAASATYASAVNVTNAATLIVAANAKTIGRRRWSSDWS
jgi:hypothetical protein